MTTNPGTFSPTTRSGEPHPTIGEGPVPSRASTSSLPSWRTALFPDVIDFQEGPGIMARDFQEFGVPLVRLSGLLPGSRVLEGCNFLDPAMVEKKWSHFRLSPGDVLLSTSASLGRTAIVDESSSGAIAYTGIIRMRPRDEQEVHPAFIRYMLESPMFQEQVYASGVGSVIHHFGPSHLRRFELLLPPLLEQRAIAAVLGALDDKIELNRKTNQTLEDLARAIFQSWFVDFDPVHANAAGRTPPGMDPGIAALFPATFQDSALGPIPEGWRVCGLDEVATYLNGLALQKYPPNGEADLPVIKIAQLRQGDAVGADLANGNVPEEYVVRDGDVLFSWSGSLLVDVWSGGTGALNQHLFKVTSEKVPKWFYFYWTRHHLPEFQATAAGKATTMGHIQRYHLRDAKALLPSTNVLSAMSAILDPLMDRSLASRLESRVLAATRDFLLPKLLSGQVRLRDAERLVP